MIKTELYTEFKEDLTDKVTVEKDELRSKLKIINSSVILEYENEKYKIYYSLNESIDESLDNKSMFHLEIDPAARIRFEGSLDEHEELLKKIYKKRAENNDMKIYSKLQDGDVDSDFFIMDIYYQMEE
ncbi:MAG: hypothetical protein K5769_05535 [Pseudobutyrivibrio sp.]|nr:hypothetical protein [Pseudobutyrivibrio sp.]